MTTVPVPYTWVAGRADAPTASDLNGPHGPKGTGDFLLSPPRATVYNAASVSLTTATWTLATFDTDKQDTDTIHSTSSNTSRLVATTPGLYLVTAQVYFAPSGTGNRGVNFTPNGGGTRASTNAALSDGFCAGVNNTNQLVSVSFEWSAAEDDFLEMWVYQSSGSGLNLVGGSTGTRVSMRWVATS